MSKKVPLRVVADHKIIRLKKEKKYLSDAIKMIRYRIEAALFNPLFCHFTRGRQEGQVF
jgi:hypothetical protein